MAFIGSNISFQLHYFLLNFWLVLKGVQDTYFISFWTRIYWMDSVQALIQQDANNAALSKRTIYHGTNLSSTRSNFQPFRLNQDGSFSVLIILGVDVLDKQSSL